MVLAGGEPVSWAPMAAPRTRPVGRRRVATTMLAASLLASVVVGPSVAAARTSAPPAAAPGTGAPFGAVVPSALTTELRRRLDAGLAAARLRAGIPGVSVAVILPDGDTWLGVSGTADLAGAVPVTADTAFAAASITKTFTAALTLALVQDGRLTLDAPVRDYLPDLDLDPAITVRQLLDHTSGLYDFFSNRKIDPPLLAEPGRRWGSAEALGYVGKPYFKPGAGWHYSNTNYVVLGLLAERVGEATLADQVRRRFLEPLGLARTFYQPTEAALGPVAHGYRFETSAADSPAIDLSDGTAMAPFTSVVTAAGGAGGMAATPADLARWARALYAGRALAEPSVVAMVGDVALTDRHDPSLPYGLGVQAVELDGRPTLGHSGRLLGFRSVVRWLPDEAISIAVMTNQSRTDPAVIAAEVMDTILGAGEACACPGVR